MKAIVRCSVCNKKMEPNNGGYGHPTKCWHCAPVAVEQRKVRRAIRENVSYRCASNFKLDL